MVTRTMLTRILNKQRQDFDFDKDMEAVLLSASKKELETLGFMIDFSEHIDEYVLDCLKMLREYKNK